MQVPFFRPEIGEDEINEVVDSLRNGWLTTGPKTQAFENDLANFLGGSVEAIAVNSATAGLHLALEAIGIGPGDEVIVPDFTFTATAEVVRYLGGEPVFVDVDPHTLNITPALAEAAVTPRTKAIVIVHFAGLPCDVPGFMRLAARRGLRIIEDSAHALPARVGGAMVGTHGTDAVVFSFYANKTITTGEGGMLVTRDPALAKRARTMRLHGFDRDAFSRFQTGSWRYDIVAPGYKYNMTDMAASLGLHQLRRAEAFRNRRAEIAHQYRTRLAGLPLSFQADADGDGMHSWHLFVARVGAQSPLTRDALFEALGDRGIRCSVHYLPLHSFTYWRERYNLSPRAFPVSEACGQTIISLPLYVGMTQAEIDYVVAALSELTTGRV